MIRICTEKLIGYKSIKYSGSFADNPFKNLAVTIGKESQNLLFLFAATTAKDTGILTCCISIELANKWGYNGGDQNLFATARGKNPDKISKALERAKDYLLQEIKPF